MTRAAEHPNLSGPSPVASREVALLALATTSMVVWQVGVYVDSWYHVHRGFAIESFLTWPHAMLYAGWAATGFVVVGYRLCVPGRLPPGYLTLLLGVSLFGLGGVTDVAWHTAFGFEVNQEVILSPAHIWLAATFTIAAYGLLQAAARYRAGVGSVSLRLRVADLPLVLALGILLRVTSWYVIYASPLTIDFVTGGATSSRLAAYDGMAWGNVAAQVAGTTGIFFHSVILALFLVVPLRTLRLPSGSITLVMLYDALLIVPATDQWLMVPAVAVAALSGEAIWFWIGRGGFGGFRAPVGYWVLGGVVPLVQCAVSFALLGAVGGGLIWTTHLWAGVPFVAGILGVSVAVLAVPPDVLRLRNH